MSDKKVMVAGYARVSTDNQLENYSVNRKPFTVSVTPLSVKNQNGGKGEHLI